MRSGDGYRAKAAKISAQAAAEAHGQTRIELESLARAYLRLAEQADRNGETDIVYLTPTSDQNSSEA